MTGEPGSSGEPIVTPRLRLVPLRVEDADEMATVLADPSLYAFTGGEPPTVASLRVRYGLQVTGRSADGTEEWLNWIVRVADGDIAIGYVQATVTDRGGAADIAWVIGVPWQGRGYASEAARAMAGWLADRGVGRITAHVHPDHVASARVATAIGLAPTGVLEDGEQVWLRTR